MASLFHHAGRTLPSYVGDPGIEYAAARQGAAFVELPWRAILSVRGRDAVAFLQGMLTQEIVGMAPGEVRGACQVDRKGHLIADLKVRRLDDGALVDVQVDRLDPFRAFLERHVILEEVRLEPIYKIGEILLCGPQAPGLAAATGHDPWPVCETGGADLLVLAEAIADTRAALQKAGGTEIGGMTLDRLRIEGGRPWFSRDMDERSLPMEVNLDSAIHYEKGCYVGQETIARVHYQGHVNRLLTGCRIRGDAPVPGSDLRVAGEVVGRLTSVAAPLSGVGDALGLTLLRREWVREGQIVTVGAQSASIEALPFKEARNA
jgi:folate-binding protein YgfZ